MISLFNWNAQQTTGNDDSDKRDNEELRDLGYVPSFRREFSSFATMSFAFSIVPVSSSIATTFDTPLLLGGPASVSWCWLLGGINSIALSSSVAEIVSAYPTCGGLYGASARLCPKKYCATVGWVVGWLNLLAQVVGLSSIELGLSKMILAAVSISTNGTFGITSGKVVGLTTGLLIFHGVLNFFKTRQLACFSSTFMILNLLSTFLIIILLLAMTPRSDMHTASYIFGTEGFINGTGGWNNGISFLLGLLSVQWTLTGYDCTAHIAEEVRRAAYIAPAAIMVATVATVVFGWLLNIVLVLCSGPFADLPGPSGNSFLTIMALRSGGPGSIVVWAIVCAVASSVAMSITQSTSRTIYAFSRDHGLPDRRFFGHVSHTTQTPLRAVCLTVVIAIIPSLLYLASPVAAGAVFSLTPMAFDLSYIIPIILRRVYHSHPEVKFKPGPYYMGDGWLGAFANIWCSLWTIFICVVFSLPTVFPLTAQNINYSAPVTIGVVVITGLWYLLSAHRHYLGPPDGGIRANDGFEKHNDSSNAIDTSV